MLFLRTALAPNPGEPDRLTTVWPTVASPASFAPPIEAREEAEVIVLTFDLEGSDPEGVRVEVRGTTLYLREGASRRGVRVFAVHNSVDSAAPEAEIAEGRLTVRLPRKKAGAMVLRAK